MSINRRALIIVALFGIGFALMLLGILGEKVLHWEPIAASLVKEGGLLVAAILVGHFIYEGIIRSETLSEMRQIIKATIDSTRKGLTLLSEKRKGLHSYYDWIMRTEPETVRIGGRSCLHRIESDIKKRKASDCAEQFKRRLKDGCKIYVLFHHPQSGLVATIASEDGQAEHHMMRDLAESIGIARKIFKAVDDTDLPAEADIQIRLSSAIPYYAFQTDRNQTVVGFYLPEEMGYNTGAWEAIDPDTANIFTQGFLRNFGRSQWLLSRNGVTGQSEFNTELYDLLARFFLKYMDSKTIRQLMPDVDLGEVDQASVTAEPEANIRGSIQKIAESGVNLSPDQSQNVSLE